MDTALPWDDCQVAFSFDGDSLGFWAVCDEQHPEFRFPFGWEPNATDTSGARCVVVFRVEGPPSLAAGQGVRATLDKIAAYLREQDA